MEREDALERYVNALVSYHHDRDTGARWYNVLGATLHIDRNNGGYYVPNEDIIGWEGAEYHIDGYTHGDYTFVTNTYYKVENNPLNAKLHVLAYYALAHKHNKYGNPHNIPDFVRTSFFIEPVHDYAYSELAHYEHKGQGVAEAVANININTLIVYIKKALANCELEHSEGEFIIEDDELEKLYKLTNPPVENVPPVTQQEWLTGDELKELYNEIKEATSHLAGLLETLPTYATLDVLTWVDWQESHTVLDIIKNVIGTEIDSKMK